MYPLREKLFFCINSLFFFFLKNNDKSFDDLSIDSIFFAEILKNLPYILTIKLGEIRW